MYNGQGSCSELCSTGMRTPNRGQPVLSCIEDDPSDQQLVVKRSEIHKMHGVLILQI